MLLSTTSPFNEPSAMRVSCFRNAVKVDAGGKDSRETDFNKPDVDGDELHFPIDTKPVRDLWANWKKEKALQKVVGITSKEKINPIWNPI